MQVYLNNIGIIKESEISIKGLTIITGDNNSGKSTIGKSICSIINSTLNLPEKNFRDKRIFTISVVKKVIRTLKLDYFYRIGFKEKSSYYDTFPILLLASRGDYSFIFEAENDENLKQILFKIIEEVKALEFAPIEAGNRRIDRDFDYLSINDRIGKAIDMLQTQIHNLYDDMSFQKYASDKILLGLSATFNDQIQPVKEPGALTEIKIEDEGDICYDLKILGNRMKKGFFYKNPFVFAHYISDCNILDKIETISTYDEMKKIELFRYRIGLEGDEDENLENVLLTNLIRRNNAYEMQQNAPKYAKFLTLINKVFSDDVIYDEGKFICKKTKLNVKNLATGSKLFAIFKLLLENGRINSETLIVLDEPENHLHPQWQLKLAEIIVKLTKNFGAKFILTTHSPSFLVALNTYSIREKIESQTNYYYTKKMSNNYNIKLEKVNDRMEEAYYALNKPYIDINDLFESLEDDDCD